MSVLVATIKRVNYNRFSAWEREIERLPDYGCIDGHIDDAATKNNYHVIYPKGDYKTLASPYVTDGKGKDACMMTSIVYGEAPFFDRFGDAMRHQFFTDAAQYFLDTYGRRNVFTAAVHMDEAFPHMHVCFFPYDTEGNLLEIAARNNGKAKSDFQDDIYEKLGVPWHMEKADTDHSAKHRTHEEYLQARLMHRYQMEVNDILNLIDSKRREYYELEEAVNGLEDKEYTLKRSIRELTQAQEAMKEESRAIHADILEDIDFRAGMDLACAEPDPSRSKDKSIRILKARNYYMQERLYREQDNTKEVLGELNDTKAQLKSALQYKDKAKVADMLLAQYPYIYNSLVASAGTSSGRRSKSRDTGEEKAQ
ncbi:MAG: plasmid recombination protein [Clostridia bacterium]|nr:plasmid recombination protein [Clostridia bacterium]